MQRLFIITLLFTTLSVPLVQAEPHPMKPGLWQHTVKFKTETGRMEKAMAEMQAQLKSMPEQQRAMMENMLKQQGMDFDFENQKFRNCLTPEQARKGDFNLSENGDCEKTGLQKQGNKTVMSFACSGQHNKGKGRITFQGNTQYSGQSQMTVDFDGQPEDMTVTHSGEWVSANCGNLAQ